MPLFEHEEEFIRRVHKMIWCSLASFDTKNRLRSRIVHPIWDGLTCWIGSRRHSLKARHLEQSPYVSLAYISDIANPVYADCTAEWADDIEDKTKAWELFQTTPPPLGFDYSTVFQTPDNPEFGVLKLKPWRIELFDIDKSKRKVWRRPAV